MSGDELRARKDVTRAMVLVQLLAEHGVMSKEQMREATGYKDSAIDDALKIATRGGVARWDHVQRRYLPARAVGRGWLRQE